MAIPFDLQVLRNIFNRMEAIKNSKASNSSVSSTHTPAQ
jgi:hypothetical protein